MTASILIVEDEEPIQILLTYNLEAEGYRVRATAQGEDVPRLVGEERPDLIVLDWMLPGISGIEVCRLLRARPETRDIPVIMLTARGEETERVRGPGHRRRRLYGEAVLGAGASGAHPHHPAPRQSRCRRRDA